MSHRLDLILKDSLKDPVKVVDTALQNLSYIYQKSSKRLREVRELFSVTKEGVELENKQVKPHKTGGKRWTNHKVKAMKGCIDKYSLYLQHIENVIADTKNRKGKYSLKDKRRQLENGSTLLDAAFFIDILEPMRRLSLATQDSKVDIIQMVTCIDKTREKYKRMLARLKKPDQVWELPTVKSLFSKISSEETYHSYQGTKIKNLMQAKRYLEKHAVSTVERIVDCFRERCGILVEGDQNGEDVRVGKESKEGDVIVHDVSKILNTNAWLLSLSQENLEDVLDSQLKAVERICTKFETPLSDVAVERVQGGVSFCCEVCHDLF